MEKTSWRSIDPKDATGLDLARDTHIEGPLNELGELCPWPWEPQQYVNAPLGQYRCGYCNGMVVAGVPHTDWRDELAADPGSVPTGQGESEDRST